MIRAFLTLLTLFLMIESIHAAMPPPLTWDEISKRIQPNHPELQKSDRAVAIEASTSGNGIPPVAVELRDIVSANTGTGTVVPSNRVEVKPPIPGRVDQLLVAEGDTVKKGDIIAWMSSIDRAALLDQARSKGAAEVKKWEALLRPTPLVAPISGTIISLPVEEGQTVAASDIIVVVSDKLMVQVQIDETDIGKVRIGQPVSIELDAYPNRKFKGKVDHIGFDAKVINKVTVYFVDVIPSKTPAEMRSGMTAYVSFLSGVARNVPALPVEAIRTRGGRSMVWVQSGRDKPHPTQVTLGLSDGKCAQISGLPVGTTVVRPLFKSTKKSRDGGGNPLNPQMGRPGGARR